MPAEAHFLAAIAASPDDDLPRLVFADWLDEQGKSARAAYIRQAIHFDPHRDRFDDDPINATREKLTKYEERSRKADQEWLAKLHGPMRYSVAVERRRGFVDSVAMPVQWWVEHGTLFRKRFPTLRKLVLFRLNGWGERLAACESLRGLRELELACWYSDADAVAVANSPYLEDLERVTVWSGGPPAVVLGRPFVRPGLKEVHLVCMGDHVDAGGWAERIDAAAGRPIATVYHFVHELFPFAPDYDSNFFIGKLPDGSQLVAFAADFEHAAIGILFHPDGNLRERFRHEFPSELVMPQEMPEGESSEVWEKRRKDQQTQRKVHLSSHTGFTPAFVRVRHFELFDEADFYGPYRYRSDVEDCWGDPDDPAIPPDGEHHYFQADGRGGRAYHWVREGGYVFVFGITWWCDRTGHVTST